MEENILAGVISGIISGVFLILFERLLMPKCENTEEKSKEVHIIEYGQPIIKEKIIYRDKGGVSEDSPDLVLWVMSILLIMAAVNYVKYADFIYFIIIAMSLAIGLMAIGMGLFCIRKGMRFRRDLNIILISNMLALIIVPFLIWKTMVSLQERGVNENISSAFDNLSNIVFLVYQILGLACIIIYMLFVLVSNIYLVSLINLNLNSGLRKMWAFLNRKTYGIVAHIGKIIMIESIFLIISYLMVSGCVLDLLNNQAMKSSIVVLL